MFDKTAQFSGRRPRASELDALPSTAFQRCLTKVRRLAASRSAPIFLQGEMGTGKTALARFIHDASPRAGGPFVSVNLAELEDALAPSELFGHLAGAFTGAARGREGFFLSASGGTLFLDEIAKTSPQLQRRLLAAIEYGEIRQVGADRTILVDVRLVVAAHESIDQLVKEAKFLPDLQARLAGFCVALPPLRERRADIPELARQLLESICLREHRPVPRLSDDLVSALQVAEWEDNVRGLATAVNRLLLESDGAAELQLEHCRDELTWIAEGWSGGTPSDADVRAALKRAKGNRSQAARDLRMHRTTLHRRLKRMGEGSDEAAAP